MMTYRKEAGSKDQDDCCHIRYVMSAGARAHEAQGHGGSTLCRYLCTVFIYELLILSSFIFQTSFAQTLGYNFDVCTV